METVVDRPFQMYTPTYHGGVMYRHCQPNNYVMWNSNCLDMFRLIAHEIMVSHICCMGNYRYTDKIYKRRNKQKCGLYGIIPDH